MDLCKEHQATNLRLDTVENKVEKHIDEAEKEGGHRDRLLIIETQVKTMEKNAQKTALFSGLIGALIGKLSPDLINFLIAHVFGFGGK